MVDRSEIVFDPLPDLFDGLAGIDYAEPFRFVPGELKEGVARTILEIVAGGFHAILAVPQSCMRGGRIHVQQICAFRQ